MVGVGKLVKDIQKGRLGGRYTDIIFICFIIKTVGGEDTAEGGPFEPGLFLDAQESMISHRFPGEFGIHAHDGDLGHDIKI